MTTPAALNDLTRPECRHHTVYKSPTMTARWRRESCCAYWRNLTAAEVARPARREDPMVTNEAA
jgi:hypothetical protein